MAVSIKCRDVHKLIALGKGRDIMAAVANEMKGGVGYGSYNGIIVTRVGRIIQEKHLKALGATIIV